MLRCILNKKISFSQNKLLTPFSIIIIKENKVIPKDNFSYLQSRIEKQWQSYTNQRPTNNI